MSSLPSDIVSEIVSYLWNNPSALKICSTMDKAFHYATCAIRFRRISLKGITAKGMSRIDALASIAPRVLIHTHHLDLHWNHLDDMKRPSVVIIVKEILRADCLRSLGIYGSSEVLEEIDYAPLLALCTMGSIQEMTLQCLKNFPHTLICNRPHMKRLRIYTTTVAGPFDFARQYLANGVLIFDNDSPFDSNGLHRTKRLLVLVHEQEEVQSFAFLLKNNASYLTSVTLLMLCPSPADYLILKDVGTLPHLNTLSILVEIDHIVFPMDLAHFLHSTPNLAQLQVSFHLTVPTISSAVQTVDQIMASTPAPFRLAELFDLKLHPNLMSGEISLRLSVEDRTTIEKDEVVRVRGKLKEKMMVHFSHEECVKHIRHVIKFLS